MFYLMSLLDDGALIASIFIIVVVYAMIRGLYPVRNVYKNRWTQQKYRRSVKKVMTDFLLAFFVVAVLCGYVLLSDDRPGKVNDASMSNYAYAEKYVIEYFSTENKRLAYMTYSKFSCCSTLYSDENQETYFVYSNPTSKNQLKSHKWHHHPEVQLLPIENADILEYLHPIEGVIDN